MNKRNEWNVIKECLKPDFKSRGILQKVWNNFSSFNQNSPKSIMLMMLITLYLSVLPLHRMAGPAGWLSGNTHDWHSEYSRSNSCPDTDYSDWDLSWFFQFPKPFRVFIHLKFYLII
jgi:hypothetical protein